MKYVRVMDGLKSNAGGFDYKLDELNISEKWDTSTMEPEQMGGFNFSTEDKILRWVHRGDTIYDVIVPEDAECILCDEEKGIYRANKIIVTNPRKLTEEMIKNYFEITTLPDNILAQCLHIMLWKKMPEISKYIIKSRVTQENVQVFLTEYGNYACNGDFDYDKLGENAKNIYDLLKNIDKKQKIK